MARPREFDTDEALDAAIGVFREHGFEGTSAQMLVSAMGIGRQSLYDSFGDKWQLYRLSVGRYSAAERSAHLKALSSGPRAIDGIAAMVERVVEEASQPCLGVSSICEFGHSRPDLTEIRKPIGASLRAAIAGRVRDAQNEGHVAAELDADATADFLIASFAGIRVAARGGAGRITLSGLGDMALRALR